MGMRKPIPEEKQEDSASKDPSKEYRLEIVWRNVMVFVYLHVAAVYGLYLLVTVAKWYTVAFTVWLHLFGGFGITGGAHRLWAHRSYKAKWPLRVIAAIAQTVAVQNDIFEWSRDHRVHHKFSETNADPHNAKRGFFFAHVGWLLCKTPRSQATRCHRRRQRSPSRPHRSLPAPVLSTSDFAFVFRTAGHRSVVLLGRVAEDGLLLRLHLPLHSDAERDVVSQQRGSHLGPSSI